jgi:hypothetical protein
VGVSINQGRRDSCTCVNARCTLPPGGSACHAGTWTGETRDKAVGGMLVVDGGRCLVTCSRHSLRPVARHPDAGGRQKYWMHP